MDLAIKGLLPLAQAPSLAYPELVKSGAVALLTGLLTHENMDIVIDVSNSFMSLLMKTLALTKNKRVQEIQKKL